MTGDLIFLSPKTRFWIIDDLRTSNCHYICPTTKIHGMKMFVIFVNVRPFTSPILLVCLGLLFTQIDPLQDDLIV